MTPREIIAKALGSVTGWARTADLVLAALTSAGFRILGPDEGVRVKPLQWNECRALYGSRKLVATDCFGREYARLDLKGQPDDFISDFKARVQEAYNTAILSALEATAASDQRELSAEDVATFDRALLRSGRKAEATPAPMVTEEADGTLRAHIGNRDVVGLLEFRHRLIDENREGVVTDDNGNEYHFNTYAVPVPYNNWHPAGDADVTLTARLIEKQIVKRKRERAALTASEAKQ